MVKIKIYKYAISQIPNLIKILIGYVLSKFERTSFWIILERGYDAQDNAWHFFKYMKENHPEIPVRFAIKLSSPDYSSNLTGYHDSVLDYGSIKYYMCLFKAPFIISTHVNTDMPGWLKHKLKQSFLFPSGRFVFLQHGIIHNDHKIFHYPNIKVDLFITGSKREYDLVSRLYGYPPNIVQYTGFARYDNLIENYPRNVILIMPTWRMSYVNLSDDDFIRTPFYKNYSDLLSSEKLKNILNNTSYIIHFYNHYEFQKFNHLFEKFESENIHILKFGCKRVQEMLKESKLLITDYSSIYYDFFYMKKPIIFFMPDQDVFREQQYGKDYDNPADFGHVALSANEVVEYLSKAIDSGCILEDRFKRFVKNVFPLNDSSNCKRIFNQIIANNV